MNLVGYSPIHESNIKPNKVYYLWTKFGEGLVLALEDSMRGWRVELQREASFQTPLLKKIKTGGSMLVPPGVGKWYEADEG